MHPRENLQVTAFTPPAPWNYYAETVQPERNSEKGWVGGKRNNFRADSFAADEFLSLAHSRDLPFDLYFAPFPVSWPEGDVIKSQTVLTSDERIMYLLVLFQAVTNVWSKR